MIEAKRISAEEARSRVTSGRALLVCAYEDDEKFSKVQLQDAISFKDLMSRQPVISSDQEIIFY